MYVGPYPQLLAPGAPPEVEVADDVLLRVVHDLAELQLELLVDPRLLVGVLPAVLALEEPLELLHVHELLLPLVLDGLLLPLERGRQGLRDGGGPRRLHVLEVRVYVRVRVGGLEGDEGVRFYI